MRIEEIGMRLWLVANQMPRLRGKSLLSDSTTSKAPIEEISLDLPTTSPNLHIMITDQLIE